MTREVSLTPEVLDALIEVTRYFDSVKSGLIVVPKHWKSILVPWLTAHRDEIELAIQQNVPLDMVLKSMHTLSNEGC